MLQALRRVRLSAQGLGGGTDFAVGLAMARDIFGAAGTAPEQANVIFLSDGEASNNFQEVSDELKGLGVNIRAIGVGRDSSLNALRRMDPGAIQVSSSDELIAAFEPEEQLLEEVPVYADFDASGNRNDGEPVTTTSTDNVFTSPVESGNYGFRPLPSGNYPMRVELPGFELTSNPIVQVQPVVPTIHLIALRASMQIDPPSIAIHPAGGEWEEGQTARLSVFAVGSSLQFQWSLNGVDLPGETRSELVLSSVGFSDAGQYVVRVSNFGGAVLSEVAAVRVVPALEPVVIVVQPRGVEVGAGEALALFVVASGGEPFSYQWRKNGVAIQSQERDQLLLQNVTVADAGEYDVVISNPNGQVVSQTASVVVTGGNVSEPVLPPLPGETPQQPAAPSLRWDRGAAALVLEGVPGASYVIEATSDPGANSWVPVTTLKLETDKADWVDPVTGFVPLRFYRARLLP